MVQLRCESLGEQLLIPAFVFFFFMLYPPAWTASRRSRTAGAAGGCMLIRPAALAAIGGLATIRST
ncbi:MAG TPA: glycosyl transferase, partial [Dokdonella sp.]|nr:glycosyl transferase [Dokdonella sp.]